MVSVRACCVRLAIVILCVAALDGAWVIFAPTPLPGATLIPATIPVWVAIFVIWPMLRKERSRQG